MALILNIETSTPVCSASIARNGECLAIRESFEDKSHASLLTVFIDELLQEVNIDASDLDAVCISEGPGSYTGLRIGVSVAKGICYAKNIPLLAVNTLKAMAAMAVKTHNNEQATFCSMIDARRMEVYSALFDFYLNDQRKTIAEVIDEGSYKDMLDNKKIVFYGNGAMKCKEKITGSNAVFIDNIYPSANYMAPLAQNAFDSNEFKNVAYFEPFYLKDFVATTPKRKVF